MILRINLPIKGIYRRQIKPKWREISVLCVSILCIYNNCVYIIIFSSLGMITHLKKYLFRFLQCIGKSIA